MVALFLASFSLTSCLDDVKDNPVTYPANGVDKTGVWKSATLADNEYDYTAVRTLTSDGKDLFYIVREGKPGTDVEGEIKTLFVNKPDSVESLPDVGMFEAFSETTFFGDGQNGTDAVGGEAYLAYRNNLRDFTLQLMSGGEILFTEKVNRVDNYLPTLAGYWEGKGETGKYMYVLFDENVGILGDENNDAEELTVSYNRETGVVTITGNDSGIVVTMILNSNMQYEATIDGETFVVDPVFASDSEPETFTPVKVGNYTSMFFSDNEGNPYVYPAVLFQSDKKRTKFGVAPFIDNEGGILFEVEREPDDDGNYAMTVSASATGYKHPNYGMIYGGDSGEAYFDGQKTYYLNLIFFVSAGQFGYTDDQSWFPESFKVTGNYEESDEAPKKVIFDSKNRMHFAAEHAMKTSAGKFLSDRKMKK